MCKLQRFGFQRTEYRKSLQYQQLAFGMSVCLLERMGVNQHHAIDHMHVCKQRNACIINGKQTQESHCPHAKICTDLLQHHWLAKIQKFIEMVKFSASFQAQLSDTQIPIFRYCPALPHSIPLQRKTNINRPFKKTFQ